jgi:hypothetical protein
MSYKPCLNCGRKTLAGSDFCSDACARRFADDIGICVDDIRENEEEEESYDADR